MYESPHVLPGQLVQFQAGRRGEEPYVKQGVFVRYGTDRKLAKVRLANGVVQWVKTRKLRPINQAPTL
jgi:hypothetical protein